MTERESGLPQRLGRADIEALFRAEAERLRVIVRHRVRDVPDAIVEDACQTAWSRLIAHAERVRGTSAIPWLIRTAVRETLRIIAIEARDSPLESRDRPGGALVHPGPGTDELAEARVRLAMTAELAERQRQMLWLHAAGLSYAEIARRLGCTQRTVERQLLRAKRTMRERAA